MEIPYRIERDPTVLNPEIPAGGHGIATAVLAAYNVFVNGRHGWDISRLVPEFDEVPVMIFSPDNDPAMKEEDRIAWNAALKRFGLRRKD